MNFINILFCIILDLIICLGYGSLLFYLIKIKYFKKVNIWSEITIAGIFIVGVISLFLNFIIPIDSLVANTITLLGILLFLLFFYQNINKNLFFFFLTNITLTIILLISAEHQQDFPWYSLPFISNLNHEKISFGLANVQYRFGFISLLQYTSAAFNNYSSINNIIVPYPLLSATFIIFCSKCFLEVKNNLKNKISFLYISLILIFCLIKFNRLSSYGNDVPLHILIFYSIYKSIYILENYKKKIFIQDEVKKLILFSTFAVMQKIQGSLIILFPAYIIILLNNKIKKLLIRTLLISFLCLSFWTLKTFINTGCFLYPAEFTCVNNVSWVGKDYSHHSYAPKVKIENEAWSKAWIDQKKKILDYENYSKNFHWLKTWSKKHFIVILKSIFPFILITAIPFLYFLKKKNYLNLIKNNRNYIRNNKILFLLTIINIMIWFIIFPIYRYGTSFIISGITFLIIPLYVNINKQILYEILKKIIKILFVFFISKNLLRIYHDHRDYIYSPWPKIFSEKNNYLKDYKKVLKNDGEFILLPNDEHACYYSPYTCSSSGHVYDKNFLIKFKNFNYKSYEYK
jgi:hypothetical protein